MKVIILLIFLLGLYPIQLKVSPFQCSQPCSVRVTLTIEPDPRNRGVCLEWEDGSSCWGLEGERAPRTTQRTLMLTSQGEQDISALLYRSDRMIKSNSQTVNVQ